MAERTGYWDVSRCAWVGAEPTDVVPPAVDVGKAPAVVPDGAVPEPRSVDAQPLVAGAPD